MGERFENIILSPRYSLRLEDMSDGYVFQAVCLRCDRTGIVQPETLRARFSDNTLVREIEEWMRCQVCGHVGGNRLKPGRVVSEEV